MISSLTPSSLPGEMGSRNSTNAEKKPAGQMSENTYKLKCLWLTLLCKLFGVP